MTLFRIALRLLDISLQLVCVQLDLSRFLFPFSHQKPKRQTPNPNPLIFLPFFGANLDLILTHISPNFGTTMTCEVHPQDKDRGLCDTSCEQRNNARRRSGRVNGPHDGRAQAP